MKYLLHFECDYCGYKWQISANSIIDTLEDLRETGCPKNCSNAGTIKLTKHEFKEDLVASEMIHEGFAKVEVF
ncbi:MAG: hypothetical protein BWY04_01069 [candidate division CPR1 bacterium ADurb.Bin160]|uniref:Uncharacterized protein n=1 Tax=candidate division CPR1 bacterium ADurb.Bin160 TaxID=1852826 RepID=A0A1V5ZLG3_9BACT|nr:MAG: hypothetical protein BWY04_01069 [candidate division CPR1 bacterium ADurb.Bin160]